MSWLTNLIYVYDKGTGSVGRMTTVDVICLDFITAFDIVPMTFSFTSKGNTD